MYICNKINSAGTTSNGKILRKCNKNVAKFVSDGTFWLAHEVVTQNLVRSMAGEGYSECEATKKVGKIHFTKIVRINMKTSS